MSESPITDDVPSQRRDAEAAAAEAEADVNVLDLLVVLAKHKLLIIGFPLAVAVLAAGYSLTLPFIYTGNAKIFLPQVQVQSAAAAAMMAQVGGLMGTAGAARTNIELYIGMLRSRTVADNLLERFDLLKVYESKRASEARTRLANSTAIAAGKDGIIVITVDDESPKRAADLTNAYIEELMKLTQVLAVTEASQRRLFFERQLQQAKENLIKAERNAREGLQKGGLIQVEGQGKALLETTARLRGQITVKEVQISAMRTFASERNAELQLAYKELDALKGQLARIEGVSGGKVDAEPEAARGMDSLGLLRNVKYYETMYDLLARQYEVAKVEEAKESSVVQVIDHAVEPDMRTRPKRSLIVLLGGFVGGIVAILAAFVLESVGRLKTNPEQARRLYDLRRYLSFRRASSE